MYRLISRSVAHSLPARSPFLTGRRNEILDLLANVGIFPAYLLCIKQIISFLISEFLLPSYAGYFFWAGAVFPLLNISGSSLHWRLGFKGRKSTYAICLILFIYFLLQGLQHAIFIWGVTAGAFLIEFLLRRLIRRYQDRYTVISTWTVILFVTILFCFLYEWFWITKFYSFFADSSSNIRLGIDSLSIVIPYNKLKISIVLLVCALQITMLPFPIAFGMRELWETLIEKYKNRIVVIFLSFVIYLLGLLLAILLFSFLYWARNPFSISLIGLSLIILATNPVLLLSRQWANVRAVLRPIREDFIHSLISPSTLPSSPLIRKIGQIEEYLRSNATLVNFFFIWISAGIILPIYLLKQYSDLVSSITEAITIGITCTVSLLTINLIYWIIKTRPKHIVLPFTAPNGEKDSKLDVIAHLMTQAFTEELKHIYVLLNMRQVENLSLRNNGGLSVFVTSVQDQELIEQIQFLENAETTDPKRPFWNFLRPLLTRWASTHVHGSIRKQENNTISIWVEYSQRGGRTVAVDLGVIPENSASEIDQYKIKEIAHDLAVKLVHKLGHHAQLASSWESLKYFIEGLDAAYHRNWWHAISRYQKAVQIEDSARSSFGYGYYHLGAMLIFQGEIAKGRNYLQHAEMVGTPLAETHYMLALAEFYQHRHNLHTNRVIAQDIIYRCKRALALRPDFPEADHLLGTVYYQRGRLRDRTSTYKYHENDSWKKYVFPSPSGYKDDYNHARIHLSRAVQKYDRTIRHLPKDVVAQSTVFDEQSRLVQDRMAATHRLADALRCLGRYSEAESYYREAFVALPRNNRTLIDIAKTYCLSGNWARSYNFLVNEVLIFPELNWNKSTSFYMAWTLFGGIAERRKILVRILDWHIRLYEWVANRGRLFKKFDGKALLWEAVNWIDFALRQYPAYLYRWQQLDWLNSFEAAVRVLESKEDKPDKEDVFYKTSILGNQCNTYHLRYWLAWRVKGYNSEGFESLQTLASSIAGQQQNLYIIPQEELTASYKNLKRLFVKYSRILVDDKLSGSIRSLKRRWKCLALGVMASEELAKCKREIRKILRKIDIKTGNFSFGQRWAIDLYAEFSLITIKCLVEGKAFDLAKEVAEEAIKDVELASDLLETAFVNTARKPLGGRILSYQLSTLYAWASYCIYMTIEDVTTRARTPKSARNDKQFDIVQSLVNQSLERVNDHPLANYVQALLNKKLGLFTQAITDLSRLSANIMPYDPHKYNADEMIDAELESEIVQSLEYSDSLLDYLYRQEQVQGRNQFDLIVNMTKIHYVMAGLFATQKKDTLVAEHLLHAIRHSAYQDMTAKLFLDLANVLNQQERFQEALTASEEAKKLHIYLSPYENFQAARSNAPFVLECTLMKNIGNYPDALEKADRLSAKLDPLAYIKSYENLLDDIAKTYDDLFVELDQDPKSYMNIPNSLSPVIKRLNEEFDRFKTGRAPYRISMLVNFASYCLLSENLSRYLTRFEKRKTGHLTKPYHVFTSQLIAMLSRDLFDQLIYWSEIQNDRAFNMGELNYEVTIAIGLTLASLDIMWPLYLKSVPSQTHSNQRKRGARAPKANLPDNKLQKRLSVQNLVAPPNNNSRKRLQNELDPLINLTASNELRLANYLDTYAWVLYRKGGTANLHEAYDLLANVAMEFGANLAIVHYHLSKICIRRIEYLWLDIPAQQRLTKELSVGTAGQIREQLYLATLYIQQAKRLDPQRTLNNRLQRVEKRLQIYRKDWAAIILPPQL